MDEEYDIIEKCLFDSTAATQAFIILTAKYYYRPSERENRKALKEWFRRQRMVEADLPVTYNEVKRRKEYTGIDCSPRGDGIKDVMEKRKQYWENACAHYQSIVEFEELAVNSHMTSRRNSNEQYVKETRLIAIVNRSLSLQKKIKEEKERYRNDINMRIAPIGMEFYQRVRNHSVVNSISEEMIDAFQDGISFTNSGVFNNDYCGEEAKIIMTWMDSKSCDESVYKKLRINVTEEGVDACCVFRKGPRNDAIEVSAYDCKPFYEKQFAEYGFENLAGDAQCYGMGMALQELVMQELQAIYPTGTLSIDNGIRDGLKPVKKVLRYGNTNVVNDTKEGIQIVDFIITVTLPASYNKASATMQKW